MGTGIRTEKGSSFPPKMISRKVLFSLGRSEEHTSELQSRLHLVCRLLLEKKKKNILKHRHEFYEVHHPVDIQQRNIHQIEADTIFMLHDTGLNPLRLRCYYSRSKRSTAYA